MPQPLAEIEDECRLFQELWIARENPASLTPRSGVLIDPAPDGGSADLSHRSLVEKSDGETRPWQTGAMGRLTGESFYPHDETGTKSGTAVRLSSRPSKRAKAEAHVPLPHDLAWCVESRADDFTWKGLSGEEDDFGADDFTIR